VGFGSVARAACWFSFKLERAGVCYLLLSPLPVVELVLLSSAARERGRLWSGSTASSSALLWSMSAWVGVERRWLGDVYVWCVGVCRERRPLPNTDTQTVTYMHTPIRTAPRPLQLRGHLSLHGPDLSRHRLRAPPAVCVVACVRSFIDLTDRSGPCETSADHPEAMESCLNGR
jgi:hypothetical protein